MIAHNSSFAVNVQAGIRWHGSWPEGYIETNRLLYDYELVYFGSGSGRVITARVTFPCGPGAAVIIPPGLAHCTVADSGLERWCIHFNWRGDCRAYRERRYPFIYLNRPGGFDEALMAGPPGFEFDFPVFRQLDGGRAERMNALLRAYFMNSPQRVPEYLRQQGLLLQILALAMTEPEPGAAPKTERGNSRFFHAKTLLDSRFRMPELKIRDIAAELRITPNHLVKLFRRHAGMSVLDYLRTRRLEHAAGLLRETTLTVREIAAECGFDDPNYFTRCFHRHYGRTPTACRGGNAASTASD